MAEEARIRTAQESPAHRRLERYAIAVAAVGAGALLRLALSEPLGHNAIYVTFYPAVMLAAVVGGLWPGTLATCLSALIADLWILPPAGQLPISAAGDALSLGLFFCTGVFVSGAVEMYHRARRRTAEYEKELALHESEERYRELARNANGDLTERRRIEQSLAEHAALLQEQAKLLDLAHVLIRDPEDHIVAWNTGAAALYGFSKEEAVGQVSHELFQTVFPVSKEAVAEALAAVGHWQGELVHTARDGSKVVVASHQMLHRDEDGRVVAVVEVNNDITELKRAEEALRESEEQLRTMVDAIPQLAWMARPDGYLFWYNRRWYEYTGTTPEQMEGWGWQSLHDPKVLPKVLEKWNASIATGEPFSMEFPLLGADGEFRTFLTRVMPLKDSEGRVLRWFGTNTDVSETRELEAHKREFYRRTILAATEGKLFICETKEVEEVAGPALERWDIHAKHEAGALLGAVEQLVRGLGMEGQRVYEFMGCITEAVANALKHADGGTASLHRLKDGLICVVSDSGPGIGAMALPDVALTKNYSTAGTLGMGFKLMVRFADRVYLATGPEGTTVAIEKRLRKDPAGLQAAARPHAEGLTE